MAPALLPPERMLRRLAVLAALVIALPALSACVALPALAPAAMNAGGNLVKAGTVRLGGATLRTFSVPLAEVYQATRATLDDLGFQAPEEEMIEERVVLRTHGVDRTVRIDLQPVTGAMTQMRLAVRKGTLGRDDATASELVARIDQALEPRVQAWRRASGVSRRSSP